jgi:hypothetical protein
MIVSRYFPFRKFRYACYAVILVVAFVFNLFQASFWYEAADSCMILLINFIFLDFFWNILYIKNRKITTTLICIGAVVFGAVHLQWIISGPKRVEGVMIHRTVSLFKRDNVRYAIKEKDLFSIKKPARLITLSKRLGTWPFEVKISDYRTPEGFSRTPFSYTWTETDQGVRVDLRTAGYTLWTMGEGF